VLQTQDQQEIVTTDPADLTDLIKAPRIWNGAVSAMYMGTISERLPTDKPTTQRPIMI